MNLALYHSSGLNVPLDDWRQDSGFPRIVWQLKIVQQPVDAAKLAPPGRHGASAEN